MAANNWQKLAQDGIDLIRQGQAQRALALLVQAHRRAPRVREVNYWLANAYRMTGQTSHAHSLFRKLLAERPDDLESSFALAFLLRDMGKPAEASTTLVRASRFPGVSNEQLLQITGFLRDINQAAAAIEVCEAAVARAPEQADLRFKLARLYQTIGSFDRAREELRKTLDLDPSTGPAWTLLAQQKSFLNIDDADYRRILDARDKDLGHEATMCLSFAHGKALDDLGRLPQAWEQYQEGNRQASAMFQWNHQDWDRFVNQAIDEANALRPGNTEPGRNAVFIVGMPRSGTTLLEQLLIRHPSIIGRGETNLLANFAQQVSAADELTGTRRQELAKLLWTQLRLDGPETAFYVDKNPLNFRYLGTLFRLLPGARIVHIRRDGSDSCLSCWFQLFQHLDTSFSYRHEDLLSFYAGYRRLMANWEHLVPNRIHTLDYGELVKSPDEALERALNFLGLEWHDAMTRAAEQGSQVRSASVWQARQDVHTQSIARWRGYYKQAPEFFDRLAEIDAEHLLS